MIKRISFLFCAVLMMVVMFAVPAFAAENDGVYIVEQPKDFFLSKDKTEAFFTISVHGEVESYQWEYRFVPDGKWLTTPRGVYDTYSMTIYSHREYCLVRCKVTFTSGEVIYSDEAAIINYPNYFLYYSSRAIQFVTNWVGSITSALLDSDGAFHSLLPILAIGIAVSGVLLVTKIFKSFSWGL